MIDPALGLGAVPADRAEPVGPAEGRPPLPPGRVRRHLGRAADRPSTTGRQGHRQAAPAAGTGRRFDRDTRGRWPTASRRSTTTASWPPWWLYRMLVRQPHPLREKLTLFWHNHFATSNAKVQNAGFMLGQYDLMRRHALGNFRDAAAGDVERPGHAGLARHQPEQEGQAERELRPRADGTVQPRHRPLHREGHPRGRPRLHRLGDQGRQGRLQRRPARRRREDRPRPDGQVEGRGHRPHLPGAAVGCPYFIVGKLFRFLVSETVAADAGAARAAGRAVPQERLRLRRAGRDGAALEPVLLADGVPRRGSSRRSISPSASSAAWKGTIGTTALAAALEELGQNVFYPPSVKGWDGGPAWLNGQTLLFRQNLALALTSTEDDRFGRRTRPGRAGPQARQADRRRASSISSCGLFLQDDVPAGVARPAGATT